VLLLSGVTDVQQSWAGPGVWLSAVGLVAILQTDDHHAVLLTDLARWDSWHPVDLAQPDHALPGGNVARNYRPSLPGTRGTQTKIN